MGVLTAIAISLLLVPVLLACLLGVWKLVTFIMDELGDLKYLRSNGREFSARDLFDSYYAKVALAVAGIVVCAGAFMLFSIAFVTLWGDVR